MTSGVLVWIPARGGSKRIAHKNLRRISGASLLSRTVWFAREFARITDPDATRVMVDTDDRGIAREARAWRAEVPFLREEAFARSDTGSVEALGRFLSRLEREIGWVPDVIVLLQVTSPLRTLSHALDCWKAFSPPSVDSVVSVRQATVEANAALRLDAQGRLTRLPPALDNDEVVCPSGAFYAARTSWLARTKAFTGDGVVVGVRAQDQSAHDVDEYFQLDLARGFVSRGVTGLRRRTFLIAEAGVNHNGNPDLAHRLVDAAADAGADAVKFQTFVPEMVASPLAAKAPYQSATTGKAGTQAEMLATLTLPGATLKELLSHADERGIEFLSTPFDEASAVLLADLGVRRLKIASGEITNWPFLARVGGLGIPLLMSTGMSTLPEVADAVEVTRRAGCVDLTLLHCVSMYPAPTEEANLRAISVLAGFFDLPVGWSDHTLGSEVSLTAVALGACMVEKHLTLSRDLPGPDHAASMEPEEFTALCRGIRVVEASLGTLKKRPAPGERPIAEVARRSLHAARDLPAGHVIRSTDLVSLRPGSGIPPTELGSMVGRVVGPRQIGLGEMLRLESLERVALSRPQARGTGVPLLNTAESLPEPRNEPRDPTLR